MNDHKPFSLQARVRSFVYALNGMATLIRDEHNARIHLLSAAVAVLLGFLLHISASEWCAVVILIGAVLALEAANSAIEAICDLVSPEYHPLVKKAKDIAAAAVLFMAISAAVVGIIIFLPKLF